MKNNNKTYGCELIQKMKQDIDKLKKDTFTIPCLVKIVLSLAGIIIFAFVVRTFIPSRSPETINYNIIVNKANENCKSEIKTEMAEALVKVEERAVNAYNDNFATLMTILTIFGIAWPVIIQMLQLKFNEKKINEIELATEKIKQIEKKTKEINLAIAMSHEASMILFGRIYHFSQNDFEKRSALNGFIISCDHVLNYRVKNAEKDESIALLKYFLKFLDSVPTGIKDHVKTSIRRKAKPLDAFVSGKEIKELLGEENIELYRQYRAFFIDLYPWKFNGDGEPNEN